MLTAITNVYQPNAKGQITIEHPFKKYFEELSIGDQLITAKRMITSEDIEGILTRLIQQDPELAGIGAIIFDEFHERHLAGDLGAALTLDVQATLRPELRLLLMSATLGDISAIAEDASGELFATDLSGGELLRVVADGG